MLVIEKHAIDLIPLQCLISFMITASVSCSIVFGGAVPFIFQYLEIRKRKSAAGFSLLVCLALCISNILRIGFWFGKQFELILLLQSIGMVVYMIPMLEISARMSRIVTPLSEQTSIWKGNIIRAFWKWDDLSSYIFTLLAFALVSGTVTYFFLDSPVYIEGLGTLSLLIEACLGMPQLIRNFQRKSTRGLSIKMVLTLAFTEMTNTAFYIVRRAPPQFWIFSSLQFIIDILILLQVYFYRNEHALIPTHIEPKLKMSMSTSE